MVDDKTLLSLPASTAELSKKEKETITVAVLPKDSKATVAASSKPRVQVSRQTLFVLWFNTYR